MLVTTINEALSVFQDLFEQKNKVEINDNAGYFEDLYFSTAFEEATKILEVAEAGCFAFEIRKHGYFNHKTSARELVESAVDEFAEQLVNSEVFKNDPKFFCCALPLLAKAFLARTDSSALEEEKSVAGFYREASLLFAEQIKDDMTDALLKRVVLKVRQLDVNPLMEEGGLRTFLDELSVYNRVGSDYPFWEEIQSTIDDVIEDALQEETEAVRIALWMQTRDYDGNFDSGGCEMPLHPDEKSLPINLDEIVISLRHEVISQAGSELSIEARNYLDI
ncbi:hypothetical protein [Propionivibrio sp.]|uniref:hypothetical protein n=1 Tax=Propionivibrio sp. TaxID=2212460 RepID=UPI003BF3110D